MDDVIKRAVEAVNGELHRQHLGEGSGEGPWFEGYVDVPALIRAALPVVWEDATNVAVTGTPGGTGQAWIYTKEAMQARLKELVTNGPCPATARTPSPTRWR